MNKTLTLLRAVRKKILGLLAIGSLAMAISLTPENARADAPANVQAIITQVMCRANKFLTGTIGKAIVVVVVISSAMGMFFGKITWVTTVIIIAGIGLMFGGVSLVNALLGGTDCKSTDITTDAVAVVTAAPS